MAHLLENRAAAGVEWNLVGCGSGISGVLEPDRAAAGFSGESVSVAAVPVSSGDQPSAGRLFLCGFCDYADSSSLCVFHRTGSVSYTHLIALIGANGAGKTTTLQTITGLISPKKGQITFEGQDITHMPAHKIFSMGMAHVPEGRRVFAQLSVLDNLKLGAFTRKDKE